MTSRTMAVQTLSKGAAPEEIYFVLDRDGVVIVEGVAEPDLLSRLNADLDPRLSAMQPAQEYGDLEIAGFWGLETKRVMGLAAFSDAFVELLQSDTILGVADLALLPHCRDYVLSTGMAIQVGPGEPAQQLHPDDTLWPALMEPEAPMACMFTITACNDFTEANGATRVIPGSHRWPRARKPGLVPGSAVERLDSVPAEMAAGSTCLMSSKTVHGAGANVTDNTVRRGVFMGFCLGYLRGEEAVPLTMTPRRLRQLPTRVRYLLGWGGIGPRLTGDYPTGGWAYDMGDPINIVECGQPLLGDQQPTN